MGLKMVSSKLSECQLVYPEQDPGWLMRWIAPLLLTPCLQHWIVSAISVILSVVLVLSLFFYKSGQFAQGRKYKPSASLYYWTTLALAGFVAVIHFVSTFWKWYTAVAAVGAEEFSLSLFQFSTWLLSFLAIKGARDCAYEKYMLSVRFKWVVNCLTSTFMVCGILFRFGSASEETAVNEITVAITFPVALFLFAAAVRGTTGVKILEALTEPLLGSENGGEGEKKIRKEVPISQFPKAGIINRWCFLWVNPVLQEGYKKPLRVEDVPRLGKAEDVEGAFEKFKREWERGGQGGKFLPRVIIRAHWRLFAVTGFLGVVKLIVMYVGPVLIQQFVNVTSDPNSVWQDGALLVGILLLAKTIEVVCDHQSNFIHKRIGMQVWSGLVAAIYQKGLRITSGARQSHGTGKIVNYMSVDAETISQVLQQLHDLWGLPLQITLAMVILYSCVGVATFAGIGTMVFVMVLCLIMALYQKKFQEKIMKAKDYRVKLTTEALNNMKIIKLCAWQDMFLARIESARATERIWITRLMYLGATSIFLLWLSPLAVSVLTFGTCVFLGTELTAGKVFTAIAMFRIVQEPLRSFPSIIMSAAQAMVSVRRLKTYLESPELDLTSVSRVPAGESCAVVVKDGVFKWEPQAESPTLKNINIEVQTGSLAAIVGMVGSGKSALLSCMLGEMEKVSGSVTLSGNVAYVSQSAWMQNGSIKDNILFGKAFDETLYKEILRISALHSDLAQMIHGDQTEIGERGINLSGGQKQRVQLARALYQDADVYLLDDIFSALDAHTGSSIFQECVRGYLSGKTVLLVTHQVEFLRGADVIVVMRDGEIVQSGKYNELTEQGTDFSALVDAHNESLEADVVEKDQTLLDEMEEEQEEEENSPNAGSGAKHESLKAKLKHKIKEKLHKSKEKTPAAPVQKSSAKLIEEEEREQGRVDLHIYWAYCTKVFFGTHAIALLIIQTLWQVLQIASDFWLANSTSAKALENFNPERFIKVYAWLALGSGAFVALRSFLVSFSGIMTAQRFFLDMIRSVFKAPMSFFDTTPTGRVLSRSSTDQVNVDFYLPFLYGTMLAVGFQLIGVLVVMSEVTWQLVFLIVPCGIIFISYQRYFISTARELTRLESITQAPIIQHFAETISGFATVRAFGHQERFIKANTNFVSVHLGIQFYNFATYEWMGLRLEIIGTFLMCASALVLVLLPKNLVRPELVGLSLSYGLGLTGCLFFLLSVLSTLEQRMVAVERILQYSHLTSEAPPVIVGHRPDPSWPSKGSITMKNVQMRYRPDTPLVLKGVSFTLKGGEKLGVVGRTGSGKSSLIQALFRIVELAGGHIVVDRMDIGTIGLRDLRSKFSIIPQEPTLFEGNVRNNVDPQGDYSDADIWEALEKSQLGDVVREKEGKLDCVVAENGDNWSMGQRQLFCLSRALLRKSKVLVLDEATASVDTQTDVVLQKIITREFSTSTVISIAHRIPTVMDSDKVLVLDSGTVAEFGSPSNLLDQQSSLFSALVQDYWNRSMSLHNLADADIED